MPDVFGDLHQSDKVLATLERLRADGRVDEHQPYLARLVRYQDDRRLQRAALECALDVERSSDLLIAEALNALVCRETPLTTRVTAARATGHLLSCHEADASSPYDLQRAYETLEHIAAQEQPPILSEALHQALSQARPAPVRQARRTGRGPQTHGGKDS